MGWRSKALNAAIVLTLLSGCAAGPLTGREKGALGGGALGAGAGALIGHQTGHAAGGAAIGGVLGALTGGILGDQSDYQNQRAAATERELARQRREIQRLKHRRGDDTRY